MSAAGFDLGRLPVPMMDMEGEDAADFIDQIAELYTGVDRWHVRRLAAHLRAPPDAPDKAALELGLTDLRALVSELEDAQSEADHASSRLEDAAYRLRQKLAALDAERKL